MAVAELRGVRKRYGQVNALVDVSVAFQSGEVHAIVGENGAGKSSLMRLLYGLALPDAGEIRLKGELVRLKSPAEARRRGVAMVHQHFRLVPGLTAVENWALGQGGFWVDRAGLRAEMLRQAKALGFELDPDRAIEQCSVGEKQRLEILQALALKPSLLILDEPTAVLGPTEVHELLALLRRLAWKGMAVALVTHKLDEVETVADRVSVLRQGALVHSSAATEIFDRPEAHKRLAAWIVGQDGPELEPEARRPRPTVKDRPICLELEDVSVPPDGRRQGLSGIRLELREGEILGIAGVEGNGQEALCGLVSGLQPASGGQIRWKGGDWLAGAEAAAVLRKQTGHVPADRQRDGLALDLPVAENLALRASRSGRLQRRGWISTQRLARFAEELVRRLDIRTPALSARARTLSGGNQQKLVLARELDANPGLLVAAHPTHGVDVAATAAVWARLQELAATGVPVLLVSSDLEEILRLSDRVAVLRGGQLLEAAPGATRQELGALMIGGARS